MARHHRESNGLPGSACAGCSELLYSTGRCGDLDFHPEPQEPKIPSSAIQLSARGGSSEIRGSSALQSRIKIVNFRAFFFFLLSRDISAVPSEPVGQLALLGILVRPAGIPQKIPASGTQHQSALFDPVEGLPV